MKEIAGVTVAMALLIGISALAIERFDDRELFVSPPDAVAEGFVREVVTKRWDRARTYLVDPDSMSNAGIEALQKAWGDPSTLDAEMVTRTDERASVNVRWKSAEGSEVIAFELVFDGEWKIAPPPAIARLECGSRSYRFCMPLAERRHASRRGRQRSASPRRSHVQATPGHTKAAAAAAALQNVAMFADRWNTLR